MPRKSDTRIEKAKVLYLAGMKLIEIAKELDVPEGTEIGRASCRERVCQYE